MKPSSLHALVIDRHLGELSPEAAELLELHLAGNPAARAEAERILRSLAATHDAMLRHPELARVAPAVSRTAAAPRRATFAPWLAARAAAIALLACLTAAGGFLAGRSSSPALVETREKTTPPAAPRKESPWARYRMTFNPAGEGMQVVRVDTSNLENKAIP